MIGGGGVYHWVLFDFTVDIMFGMTETQEPSDLSNVGKTVNE